MRVTGVLMVVSETDFLLETQIVSVFLIFSTKLLNSLPKSANSADSLGAEGDRSALFTSLSHYLMS